MRLQRIHAFPLLDDEERVGAPLRLDRQRVLGVDGLVVADASLMPTIPRANTNLTTAAIAERVAASIG